jgi:HPt (histidine-containing phosphotransfer) domain-containing protein
LPDTTTVSHSLLSDTPAGRRNTCGAQWTPPPPLVDLAADDEGLIAEMIDLFKTGAETLLQQMRIALATVDIQKLRSGSHTLRGSALQLGADALAGACQRLELATDLTPVSNLVALVDRVQTLFTELSSAMASYSNATRLEALQPPQLNRSQ